MNLSNLYVFGIFALNSIFCLLLIVLAFRKKQKPLLSISLILLICNIIAFRGYLNQSEKEESERLDSIGMLQLIIDEHMENESDSKKLKGKIDIIYENINMFDSSGMKLKSFYKSFDDLDRGKGAE